MQPFVRWSLWRFQDLRDEVGEDWFGWEEMGDLGGILIDLTNANHMEKPEPMSFVVSTRPNSTCTQAPGRNSPGLLVFSYLSRHISQQL